MLHGVWRYASMWPCLVQAAVPGCISYVAQITIPTCAPAPYFTNVFACYARSVVTAGVHTARREIDPTLLADHTRSAEKAVHFLG